MDSKNAAIYFVRHGESQANVDRLFVGPRFPSPLTAKGREQARLAGEHIKAEGLTIDRIISSPIERAKDTAAIIAQTIGFNPAAIQYDARLAEYDMGILDSHPLAGVTPQQLVSAPNAEDPLAFQRRVVDCIREIQSLPGTTLVVSHAGVGRIIQATRQGSNPRDFYGIPGYPNAQVVKLEQI